MKYIKTFEQFVNESSETEIKVEIKPDVADRNQQIQFILKNATKAGYPDLENEEFVSSLTDTAVQNFYKMLELILTYNDPRV
jgi:hypothetical protein